MYLLDSNILIEAKNRYYAFDIVPAFWHWIERLHGAGRVFTVQKVAEEVAGQGDQLASWISNLPDSFKIAVRPDDTPHMTSLASWANGGQFRPAAASEFLSVADFYLVAQAANPRFIVVTHERSAPNSTNRIKIPDACHRLGVQCMNPFEMLRRERARFVLA